MQKTLWIGSALFLFFVAGGIVAIHGARSAPADRVPSGKPRIVSLAPSVTEIVFALGRGRLARRRDGSLRLSAAGVEHRAGWRTRPQRGEAAGPESRPGNRSRPRAARGCRGLRRSGIRVLDVQIRNFEELFAAIRQIGEAVDSSRQAEGVVARMRAELDAVAAENHAAPRRQRPKVFVEIGDHPLMTAGGGSYLDDLIAAGRRRQCGP